MLSKISFGINILLVIAVGYLFYASPGKTGTKTSPDDMHAGTEISAAFKDTSSYSPPVVAYVNGDSIMNQYTYFIEMRKTLEASVNKSQGKIESQIKKAEQEYQQLMEYANNKGANLPKDEQQDISDRIMQLDYEIQNLKTNEENELMKKEATLNDDLMKRIHDYVGTYSQENNIDVVFNYQQAMQVILFGNEAYDITSQVVQGLNEMYIKEKAEKKK